MLSLYAVPPWMGSAVAGCPAGITFWLWGVQPKGLGWVRLVDKDPTSMPLINPNFIGEEEELRAAVESVRAIRAVMAQESLAPVIEEEMEPGPHIQADGEIGEWVKRVVTTMWHPVGTCRMGEGARVVGDRKSGV